MLWHLADILSKNEPLQVTIYAANVRLRLQAKI